MSSGGIGIREFRKISTHPRFQRACQIFLERIKNDKDLRSKSKLENLDEYKNHPEGFVMSVNEALEVLDRRQAEKCSRKFSKINGIDKIFEDDNSLIVGTDSPKYARLAAYLDKGTAPWCIAAPYTEAAEHWENYNGVYAVFIYSKGIGSWALFFDSLDYFCFRENCGIGRKWYRELENRDNNLHMRGDGQQNELKMVLRLIGKTEEELYEMISKKILQLKVKNAPTGVERAIDERNHEILKLLLKKESYRKHLLEFLYVRKCVELNFETLKVIADCGEVLHVKGCVDTLFNSALRGKSPDKLKMVEYLLKRGVCPNRDFENWGLSTMELAIGENDKELVELLYKNGYDMKRVRFTNYLNACFFRRERFEIFEWLVKHGANLNKGGTAENDTPPLLRSVGMNDLKWAKCLLKHGADVNVRAKEEGETALHIAYQLGKEDMIKLLKERGARIDIRDNWGRIPSEVKKSEVALNVVAAF